MENCSYVIRFLENDDYFKNYLELLSQLTVVNLDVSFDDFSKHFDNINSKIFVIEDNNKIIASGTLLIEKKFIRNFKSVGHIEDIVVDNNYRGKKIGKQLIKFLTEYAYEKDCYKVILDCNHNNIIFYEKCGYKIGKDYHMVQYF